ncbi:MAG TPA: adenylyltransferase/cytidyltransferase family protein [Candidatus Moranbacteria bacterium]|nr:adenylyltransferase/cytidyltransferase family protein [Candidatus Moranbacteria bacterium]
MSKKKIIGYTTGVFDLFHIGHLNILKKAKSKCDILVVGVTTDELAEKLKGKKPVISFRDRIEIVKNIKFVDKVVPETYDDKIKACKKLKFDVIFKGNDWKGSEKWQKLEDEFLKLGVKVIYFQYTKTTSSTKISRILDFM